MARKITRRRSGKVARTCVTIEGFLPLVAAARAYPTYKFARAGVRVQSAPLARRATSAIVRSSSSSVGGCSAGQDAARRRRRSCLGSAWRVGVQLDRVVIRTDED